MRMKGFGAPLAPRPPAATLPGLAWIGSLGERALGCGRWSSALTEPSQSDVRSLTRAPLARYVLLRPTSAGGRGCNSPAQGARSALSLPQAGDLLPLKRRSTPSRRRSLRNRGQAAAMSEPVLVLWASFAAARGEQLDLQARRRWSEGAGGPRTQTPSAAVRRLAPEERAVGGIS